MSILKQLLAGKRGKHVQSSAIDKQYKECKEQINSLAHRIRGKLEAKDDSTLSKFNDKYGNLLTYEESDEYEAKYTASKPGPSALDIAQKIRPKSHFPLKSANGKFNIQGTLRGHTDKIHALRWCSDNKHLVSASKDGSLIIWDMITYKKKLGIPLRMAWVMTVDYSSDGNLIASAGLDNLCSIFNIKDKVGWASEMVNTHRELQQHEGYISCNRFIDNQHILTASGDSTIVLWDIDYQQPISVFSGHNGDVESVEHNIQTNNTFISGSIDMTAKLWDYRLKSHTACINTFSGHVSDINYVKWFPDYKSFATCSDDGTCRLFDIDSYQTLNVYGDKLKEANAATCIDFSKSGNYLTVAYDEGPMCLAWNTVTAKVETNLPHEMRVSSLQFQPNGNSLVTGCWDKSLRIWV